MADALISSMVVKNLTKKEKFEDERGNFTASPSPMPFLGTPFSTSAPKKGGLSFDWFSFIISAFISAIAIYLSWSCNTAMGYGTLEKVVYAFGAGFFGVIYLFYYVLFRGDACKAAHK